MQKYCFFFIIIFFILVNISGRDPLTKPLYMTLNYPTLKSVVLEKDSIIDAFIVNKVEGNKNLSFIIKIPSEMLSENWSLSLTPILITSEKDVTLKDVVIKGQKFADCQKQEYKEYKEYVKKTIDSTLYKESYVNHEQLKYDIENMHDQYWKYFYDEWENQIAYEVWKSKQISGKNQSFFPGMTENYQEQILRQYQLRIEIQTRRYLNAHLDTTGLSRKYMKEYDEHVRKLPRFSIEVQNVKKIPKQFQYIYDSNRTLDDITDDMWKLLHERDSILMNLPVFDFDEIKQNEKRKVLMNKVFKNIVKFPINENSLIDTIVSDYQKPFEYTYTCSNEVTNYLSDTIKVKIFCRVTALDESVFNTSSQSAITYIFKGKSKKPTKKIEQSEELMEQVSDTMNINYFE